MTPEEMKKQKEDMNKKFKELVQDYAVTFNTDGGKHLIGWLQSAYELELEKARTPDVNESHYHTGIATGIDTVIEHIKQLKNS